MKKTLEMVREELNNLIAIDASKEEILKKSQELDKYIIKAYNEKGELLDYE